MCICISTCTSVYLTPHIWLHHISILTWKDEFLCMALCVSSRHSTCGPTSWIESVYASVHVLMSTGLPMSASPHLHTSMERWIPLCGTVCVFHSSTSGPTPCIKMCTCISTLIYVLTWLPMSVPSNLNSFMKTWVPLCDIVCLSQSAYFWSHTFVRMCTCINTCIYVHLTPHFSVIHCG